MVARQVAAASSGTEPNYLGLRWSAVTKPVAVMETALLVKPFDETVRLNVPSAVSVAVTTPWETVAIAVLLETQLPTVVMSCPPLQDAVKFRVGNSVSRVSPFVETITGVSVQATETVRVWVPLIEGSTFEVAVIVPVPVSCAVTSPPLEIVATF